MPEFPIFREGEFSLPDPASLPKDGGPDYNRLIFESSPYLLQHARNPVDWYPWGAEAFIRAEREDKPVFLSIGYSTCHWCHVMEHESFEDGEVASFLREHFISIKVDREERPDIDHVYMEVCQALTGGGGWPLTLFLTPGQVPFFAGTYFPKTSRWGRPGFLELIQRVNELWREDRRQLLSNGEEIRAALNAAGAASTDQQITSALLDRAVDSYAKNYDSRYGGFGGAPKFPTPHSLSFLLRQFDRTKDPRIPPMVEKTLTAMYRGGIYDHLGFGFARYSTDERWFAPHFEKMLYDNALLLMAYTEGWQASRNPIHERAAREICTYLLRDMRDPAGGFYAAENADSEGEEGKFYVWSSEEIIEELGEEDGDFLCDHFGVTERGNWESGKNILYLPSLREPSPADEARIEALRERLYQRRMRRVHPSLDDKVLTSWNGLAVAAFSVAGRIFNEQEYVHAARQAADFLLGAMRTSSGGLLHRFRRGEKGVEGFLEDYAYLVWGLIELYQTCFVSVYLEAAFALNRKMLEDFSGAEGGLFFSAEEGERLIARTKVVYDGAVPSGNSVAACNCIRLARLTGDTRLEERALGILRAFAAHASQAPTGHAMLLTALDFALGAGREIVIAGERDSPGVKEALALLRERFSPRDVILFRDTAREDARLLNLSPHLRPLTAPPGKTLVYLCRNFSCELPLPPGEALRRALAGESGATSG